jgi:hypothetical protein
LNLMTRILGEKQLRIHHFDRSLIPHHLFPCFLVPQPRGQVQPGSLLEAATSLVKLLRSDPSASVGIVTGFSLPVPETDGPPGAIAIATSLLKAGAAADKVCVITDANNEGVVRGVWSGRTVVWRDEDGPQGAAHFLRREKMGALVSIERPGVSASGKYFSMKARDLSAFTGKLDVLFEAAREDRGTLTIGIGDGGNEIGMGNVSELVRKHVPNGEVIACVTKVDHLIVAGVSNWGGYALANAISLVSEDAKKGMEDGDGAKSAAWLCNPDEERARVERAVAAGATDGITGKSEITVDGMAWDQEHHRVITELQQACAN